MADEGKKIDRKEMLRRAARDVPPAAVAFALGYGIARTGLERFLANPATSARYLPPLQKYGPAVLGAGAALAGTQVARRIRDRLTEDA
jgi:hypothetical protein